MPTVEAADHGVEAAAHGVETALLLIMSVEENAPFLEAIFVFGE